MEFIVNGEKRQAGSDTLAALLVELDYVGNWLATALNGEMVSATERETCRLVEGDCIEILSPMKGG